MNFFEVVARKKLGVSEKWEIISYEAIGKDSIIIGAVPLISKGSAGLGKKVWPKERQRCIVTSEELDQAQKLYETETHICGDCEGKGQKVAGYSVEHGYSYRPCRRCSSTGKAPVIA